VIEVLDTHLVFESTRGFDHHLFLNLCSDQ